MNNADLVKESFRKTSDCAVGAKSVTLDADIDTPSRGLIVAVAGNVAVTMANNDRITLPALIAGVIHPVSVKKVHTSGTTATGIIVTY